MTRLLKWGVAGLAGLGVVLAVLINAGIFDPIPRHLHTQPLGTHTIPAQSAERHWVKRFVDGEEGLGNAGISLQHIGGDSDIEMGILWGNDQQHLKITITPQGLASVIGVSNGKEQILLLPQPWVHVKQINEILIEQNSESNPSTTIWLNREILWQGNYPPQHPQLGWAAQTHNQETHINLTLKWSEQKSRQYWK